MGEIHEAVIANDLEWLNDLIEQGCDLNQKNSNYETALSLAVQLHRIEFIQVLIQAGDFLTSNLLDVLIEDEFSEPEVLALLIQSGLNVNERLEDSETILMNASQQGRLDIVKMLINASADPNIVSRKANFALLAAAHARQQQVLDYLTPLTSPELRIRASADLPTRFSKSLLAGL